jgi:hypothetical protein
MPDSDPWPALPLSAWRETMQNLHMWTQVVGKIRMALSPPLNHWWHVTLYVDARGLTTSSIPYGNGAFEIHFDFIEHQLDIRTTAGDRKLLPLEAEPVAAFYRKLFRALSLLGISISINPKPQEVPDPLPLDEDFRHAAYDRDSVWRFWRILLSTSLALEEYRSRFVGKCSPVHFFWGSFDLACTRFSGRVAPPRKGVITGPAYSHEEISAGFWPGGGAVDGPAFYSYTAPPPDGLSEERVLPEAAGWNRELGEFVLMYDDVRRAESPRSALLDFFETTYSAGAKLANWDRAALEGGLAVAGGGSQG